MNVTLVTVLHESAAELAVLLDSVQKWLPGAQVVAVDTGSSDGGAALARDRGADVLELPGNPGFGSANNAGLALARSAVTALVNPDCELLDDGLGRLVRAAAARDALLVPRLVGADGRVQRSAHPLPGTVGAFVPAVVHPPLLPRPVRERVEPWRAQRPRTVGWAIAACVVTRTALLRRLGPFDPDAFLFAEDLDLCLQARAEGVPTLYDPSVIVRHAGGHSTGRAYQDEPHALLARRRHEVVLARRGPRAAALDDAAQALTFATRWAGRAALGRDARREREQLRAQLSLR